MSEDQRDDSALQADLASLRASLREVRAPDGAEDALLAAYRARVAARAPEPRAVRAVAGARPRWRARLPLALAATVALVAVAALLALRGERAERGEALSAAREVAAPIGRPAQNAFRPLAFARGVSATESYSVLRVRLRLPTSAPGVGAPPDAAIEADLLVGEDGLARAIRFDEADTLFVSTIAPESGERR
jgi:hypothetical protein